MDDIEREEEEMEESEEEKARKEEQRRKDADELFKILRQKAFEGDLSFILTLVRVYSHKLYDREDEVLEVVMLGLLFKKLREKTRKENENEKDVKKTQEMQAYEFKVLFDSITQTIAKIKEEKQKNTEKEKEKEKKVKYPVPRVRFIPEENRVEFLDENENKIVQ
ncbi:MAG: hypothetical protein ACO2PO_00595 [Candidatus Calescibacterium sp.]|jgi:hypothetical protein